VTWWTVQALQRIGPAQFPRLQGIGLDAAVIVFAVAAAVATTLMFALAPAIHAARVDLAAAIRPSRAVTQDRQRRFGQRALVIAQISVSVVLLSGAALLVQGFLRLIAIDPGFTAASVTLTPLALPEERYREGTKIDGFYTALLDRLAASPGVEAVSLATSPPLAGANDTVVYREGRPPATARDRQFAQVRRIQGTTSAPSASRSSPAGIRRSRRPRRRARRRDRQPAHGARLLRATSPPSASAWWSTSDRRLPRK
jgi:hypothetical protein